MLDERPDPVEVIADQKIREAMERGEFDDLRGKGRPLNLDDLESVPPELRAAYTLLKNAGFVPREVDLRKEISELEARRAATTDPEEARALGVQIATKQLSLDMTVEKWRRKR